MIMMTEKTDSNEPVFFFIHFAFQARLEVQSTCNVRMRVADFPYRLPLQQMPQPLREEGTGGDL